MMVGPPSVRRVTMSSGVAQFQDTDTIDEVFERADRSMYRAKQKGRNCVCTELDLSLEPLPPPF